MKNTRDQIQTEALMALSSCYRAGVAITMGGGKTLIGLKHMSKLWTPNAMFLVVVPKKSIMEEWKSQAIKHDLAHLVDNMDFTTYISLDKQDQTYKAVYLDECHSLLYSHDEWLSGYKGMIIGLTGTPPKFKGSEKWDMVDKYCPIVYKYDTDQAVEDNILNDYEIIVHLIHLDQRKNIKVKAKDKEWYNSEYYVYNYWTNRVDNAHSPKEKQIMRIMRMKALMGFKSKEEYVKKILKRTEDKIIIFANTQEQADSFNVPSYHSNNPDSEMNLENFKKGNITELACVLQLNEGVNIPNLKEGIIMHAYGNERKSRQRLGRLLRLNPNEKSRTHVLCYDNTIDKTWVKQALDDLDQSKITYVTDW